MPLLNDADAVYKGSTPVDIIYAGTVRIWPEVPPPQWQPVGSFGAFDWFHANPSGKPYVWPPIINDPGVTATFDRNLDTLTVTIPTSFLSGSLGMMIGVEWPTTSMNHPDPRNPSGYKLTVDAEWTFSSSGLRDDLSVCWAYWAEDQSAETTYQWGEWEAIRNYPFDTDPVTPVRSPGAGTWYVAMGNLRPNTNINSGTIKLKSPRVTWLQLLPVVD